MKKVFRLGTRGSPLALIQAEFVRDKLHSDHSNSLTNCDIEIVPIRINNEWDNKKTKHHFLEHGSSKELFVKELEDALKNEIIDCALHSMKDVFTLKNNDLCFTAILERDDPREAFLSPLAPRLEDLPSGARIGTTSLRRKAQILTLRPDLNIIPLRGNIDKRLKKLANDEVDATVLAQSGLKHLSRLDRIASVIETEIIMPSAMQGMLGIQVRNNDKQAKELFAPLDHKPTRTCALAEQAFMSALDLRKPAPVAVLASIQENEITISGRAIAPDGTQVINKQSKGSLCEAKKIGYDLGLNVKELLTEDFFKN